MRGLMLEAKWEPKPGYIVSDFEKRTGKAITGNSIWKSPNLAVREVPAPKIGPKEVLLKVKACGVCGSDIHFYETDSQGYVMYPGLTKFPCITGHEFSGVVQEVGSEVRDLREGDMVTAEEMIWCGECKPCRAGFFNHCANLEEIGFTINGAFAEYLAIGGKYCWKLDALLERYPDPQTVYELGATVEPTSVSYNAIFIRAGGFKPGAYATVYGGGPIGLTAIALLKAAGAAKVIAFETVEERRKLCTLMGADHVFDPVALVKQGTPPAQLVMDLTHGEGAEFQFEAAGAPALTVPEMEKSLAINGKIVQVGRAAERVPMYLEAFQVRRSQFFGSQGHSGDEIFPNVIRLMASGAIDNRKMITARYTLEQAVDAIQRSGNRTDGKIMVKPS
ncbi:MAG: alcohol dehydrogenase catalytic domain-containing protein [candidate division NC10 bacterium]|nr:alcohol dehydrogenase catalytic domain-containing protein [candidate division NC10 bacterium]